MEFYDLVSQVLNLLQSLLAHPFFIAFAILVGVLLTTYKLLSAPYRAYRNRRETKLKKRKSFSNKLMNEVLEPWLSELEGKTKPYGAISGFIEMETHALGYVAYDDENLKISEPKDPDIELFDVLESHLKTGYPKIMKLWQKLKQNYKEYFERCAEVIENIKGDVIEKTRLPEWWYRKAETTEKFFVPHYTANVVYHELNYKIKTGKGEYIELLKMENDEVGTYRLRCSGYTLIQSPDKRDVENGLLSIKELMQSSDYRKKVEELINQRKGLDKDFENFKSELKNLIRSIEFDGYLKGKCKYCCKTK